MPFLLHNNVACVQSEKDERGFTFGKFVTPSPRGGVKMMYSIWIGDRCTSIKVVQVVTVLVGLAVARSQLRAPLA